MGYSIKGQPSPLEGALVAAMAISCIGSGTAFAQERQLEEVIVTTERREATEAVTAISMEVLTDDFIASNQIKDIIDLQNAVPALQFHQNGSYVQANIRGVGNPSQGGPSEQVGVPVFFDGATQGEEMALASGFFDIADVQVLRGPQATFVGQSAVGGAILVNSVRPNFDGLNGFIEALAGTYEHRKIMGAVNLTISDNLAARIAYLSENRDTFYTNIGLNPTAGGDQSTMGDQQDDNYRLSLLWEPTEKFSLWTKFEQTKLNTYGIPEQPNPNHYTTFIDHDDDPLTPSIQGISWAPNYQGPAPGTGTVVDADGDPATTDDITVFDGTPGPGGVLYDPLDPFVIDRRIPNFRLQENTRISLEATYTFDSGITFRSLTSRIEMFRPWYEGGNSAVFDAPTAINLGPGMNTWSQEFNIISPEGQRIEWLFGLYRNDRHTELHLNIPFDDPNGVFGAPCGWQYDRSWSPCPTTGTTQAALYWLSFDDVIHTAAFGQVNFQLNDTLELSVELRHNDDDNTQIRNTHLAAFTTSPTPAAPVLCPGQQLSAAVFLYCPEGTYTAVQNLKWDDTQTTGKIGLQWEPRDGHFFYAFFARGYKSGQTATAGVDPIVAEVVDDVEVGWKGTMLNGNLYAELGLYSMDYTDMQMEGFKGGVNLSEVASITNIGDSEIQGIEGSIRYFAGGFGLTGSFGYTDSELGAIEIVDERALPFDCGGATNPCPGDVNKGCVGAFPDCYDYSPFFLTISGSENLFSPKLSYTFSVDYAFNMNAGGTLTPRVGFHHADSTYTNSLQSGFDNYYRTDERDVVNFSLTYERDDWEVQLYGNNVTDEIYIEGHSNNGASVLYGDPETWGVRARYTF